MASMTPIRVRGKRAAIPAEKWHAGKQRSVTREVSPASSTGGSSVVSGPSTKATPASSRKRKRRNAELSMLDQLPAEIVQVIFEFSANLDLPFTSSVLKAQLCSRHVYLRLTTRILYQVVGYNDGTHANATDLAAAARLFSCRFMTWDFFRGWLGDQVPLPEVTQTWDCWRAWTGLKPSPALLPPPKILFGPWTTKKSDFLRIFLWRLVDITRLNPVLGELASEGASQAIDEGAHAALETLISMGVRPTTEMFRQAVIDRGCDKEVVFALFVGVQDHAARLYAARDEHSLDIDPLDPALWAWAEKARQQGDEKGSWVVRKLTSLARELRAYAPRRAEVSQAAA